MSRPNKRPKTTETQEADTVNNWQSTMSSVQERNRFMFNNRELSDVEFSVSNSEGETVTIPAHKYLLATGSDVFQAMFYGSLPETSQTIHITDCTAEGLLELLRFLYYDELELTPNVVMEVIYLAKKYDIPSLLDKCIRYLNVEQVIGPEDVFAVLPQALKYGDERLLKSCWRIVDFQTEAACTTLAFLDVTQEVLCDILERDSLHISELELFLAVDRWANNKISEQELAENGESKRKVLGDRVIHLIRFPLMSLQEFTSHVLPKEILDKDEVVDVVTYFGTKSQPKMFKTKERGIVDYEICKRFRCYELSNKPSKDYGKFFTDPSEIVQDGFNAVKSDSFTVSTEVVLIAVRLFGAEGEEYNVWLNIYKGNEKKHLAYFYMQEQKAIVSDADITGYYGLTVKLDKPVYLWPNTHYKVEVIIEGPPSCKGVRPIASVTCRGVTFKFERILEGHDGIQELHFLPA